MLLQTSNISFSVQKFNIIILIKYLPLAVLHRRREEKIFLSTYRMEKPCSKSYWNIHRSRRCNSKPAEHAVYVGEGWDFYFDTVSIFLHDNARLLAQCGNIPAVGEDSCRCVARRRGTVWLHDRIWSAARACRSPGRDDSRSRRIPPPCRFARSRSCERWEYYEGTR